MPCRCGSLKYCNGNIHFCNKSWLRFKVQLFFKLFISNMFLQLLTKLTIITTATTVVLFCFQGQLWRGFTSTISLLSVPLSEALFQRCSLVKYGTSIRRFYFKIAVPNIFRKFLDKKSVTALIFSIVMSFQYVFYPKLFSRNFLKILRIAFSKNTAGGTLLILSDYFLKISRTPFNPLMPGGNKRSYILKQTFN